MFPQRTVSSFLGCLILLLLPFIGAAQESVDPATVPLRHAMTLNNGRVRIHVPEGTKNSPRPVDNGQPSPSDNVETRLVWKNGAEELVVYCREMNRLSNPSIQKQWSVMLNSTGNTFYSVRKVRPEETSEFAVWPYKPLEYKGATDPVLLGGALVQLPDRSLVKIDCYTRNVPAGRLAAYGKLCDQLFERMERGRRSLKLKARDVVCDVAGTPDPLELSLPGYHVMNTEYANAYTVVTVRPLVAFQADDYSQLILYGGPHPQLYALGMGFRPQDATQQPDSLLDKPIEWQIHANERVGSYLAECIFEPFGPKDPMRLHVALIGNDEESVARLREVARSMRFR